MKKLFTEITLSLLLVTAIISCDEDESAPDASNDPCYTYTCENFVDGYVIGFDPCRVNAASGKAGGYVILIPQRDTVAAYNFPDNLYEFPPEYFRYYQFYSMFPDSAWDDFPIKLKYRYPLKEEITFVICRHNINEADFFNYTKNKEIIIISVTKN